MYTKESIRPYVIQVMAMDLRPWKNIQDYLKDKGFKVSRQYYTQLKKEIKESRFDRLALIAKTQFVDQHLERIAVLETIQSELWQLYHKETVTSKKADTLMKLAEIQSYISSYYDSSSYIMEKQIQKEKNVPQT